MRTIKLGFSTALIGNLIIVSATLAADDGFCDSIHRVQG
jgi:hypothetical protein